jgi:hypothetical protein
MCYYYLKLYDFYKIYLLFKSVPLIYPKIWDLMKEKLYGSDVEDWLGNIKYQKMIFY